MLHYLASVIETRMKHLDGFHEEMPTVSGAAAVNTDTVVSCFEQLQGLVHDATVASGLVVPEVIAAISGQDGGLSPNSMQSKVANAGSAERYASELYITANGALAVLEEKCVAMIEGTAKLKQFFVEYELQVHEIFVILSTFFKAYSHVKKQNEEKRKQASKAEQFHTIKKQRAAEKTQKAGEQVGASGEDAVPSRADRWAAGSNSKGNTSIAVGAIGAAVGAAAARHTPSGAQTARPARPDLKPKPAENTQPKRRNKPNPPPKDFEDQAAEKALVEQEAWGPAQDGEQF